MSDATFNILYHETEGSIIDEKDLVIVTLTRWEKENKQDYRVDDHYVLKSVVFVDGEQIVNSSKWSIANWNSDPAHIREAIAEFDRLVEAHPTLGGAK